MAPVKLPGAILAHVFSSKKDQSLTMQSTTSFSCCSTAKPERKSVSHFQMPKSLFSFSMKLER